MKHKTILLLIPSLLFISGCEYDGKYEEYNNPNSYTLLESQQGEIAQEDLTFKYIDISWHRGNVNFVATDFGTVSIEETSNVEPQGSLISRYAVFDETLFIKYASSGSNLSDKLNKDITIFVNTSLPELANLNYRIYSTIGDANLTEIPANNLYISIFYGNVTLNDVECKNAPQIGVNRGSVTSENLFFTGTLEVAANYEKVTLGLDERIKGFIPIFQIIDGTSFVYAERFPEGDNFYGEHMENDVTIRVVINHGSLMIY